MAIAVSGSNMPDAESEGIDATAPSRLTFAQAFNSLATFDITTLSGAALDTYRTQETEVVVRTYLWLAAAIAWDTVEPPSATAVR